LKSIIAPEEFVTNILLQKLRFKMKSILALLTFAFFATANAQTNDTLQISIYYNALCTDSYRFLHFQLFPIYELVKDHIELFFIPHGKAFFVDHGGYFLCQFGPNECYGNMLQLCGLQQVCRNQQAQVDFVICEMQFPFNQNRTRPECSERAGIDWSDVEICIESGFAHELKIDAGRQTRRIANPYPNFVPAIVYNGVFNQDLQNRSINNLFGVICELIDNAVPECQTSAASDK